MDKESKEFKNRALGAERVLAHGPMVLIGGPVTSFKLNVTGQFLNGLKGLTYQNKVVVLIDNSPDSGMRDSIQKFSKAVNFPFFILTTPHRAYARERLVEGENLLKDIVTKNQSTLEKYELSEEDLATAKMLMEKYEFEFLLSVEQDVIPPVNTIEMMFFDDKPIVSAVYFNSKRYPNGNEAVIPMAWNWADPDVKEIELLTDFRIESLMPSRRMQVAAIGLGCVLIRREVLEALKEFRYSPAKYACSDMYFSMDVSDLGYEIWLDTYLWCQHLHQPWDLAQVGER